MLHLELDKDRNEFEGYNTYLNNKPSNDNYFLLLPRNLPFEESLPYKCFVTIQYSK